MLRGPPCQEGQHKVAARVGELLLNPQSDPSEPAQPGPFLSCRNPADDLLKAEDFDRLTSFRASISLGDFRCPERCA